ncbi:MAG: hypothetical protein ACJA2D_000501 [Pseudohongiellaceae bacterium]
MEGYWTNETQTPLQRDISLGNKLALSADEAQAAEEQRRNYLDIANSDIDPDRSAPTDGFVDASYNQFWLDGFDEMMTVNGEFRTSIIVDPANGRIPFLPGKETPMYYVAPPPPGFTILDGPEVRPLGDRCLTSFGYHAGPVMLPFLYNNNYQIVQTTDYIVILVEMVHDARIIRMKDSALPENMSQWMGDALGHWEGDTLVVESRNFNSNQHFFNASMDNLLVTERFTRVAQDRINFSWMTSAHFPVNGVASCPLWLSPPVKKYMSMLAMKVTMRCPAFSLELGCRKLMLQKMLRSECQHQ